LANIFSDLNKIKGKDFEFGYFSAIESDYKEPTTFKNMMKLPEEERSKWMEGVIKEFTDLEKRGVWEIKNIKDIPVNRKLIGTKWVFKKKRSGVYRSRLVLLGYNQIPEIDFTDNFSPVVHNITLRMILTYWMILNLDIDQMDVETAFLEGILEPHEYVYLKCPEGMYLLPDECLEVHKGLYGLVTAA
jgi:Reverse transcriptase (RNA-dependent DNA polymerase)